MTYLIGELVVLLVLSVLAGLIIGIVIGWQLFGGRRGDTEAEADEATEARIAALEAEADDRDHAMSTLRAELAAREQELATVRSRRRRVPNGEAASTAWGAPPPPQAPSPDAPNAGQPAEAATPPAAPPTLDRAWIPDDVPRTTTDEGSPVDRAWLPDGEAVAPSPGGGADPAAAALVAEAVSKAPPAAPASDLSELPGLDRDAAEALRRAGVTSVEQLAALSPDEVAELDRTLGPHGRAARDRWVAQATDLLAYRKRFGS